MNILITGASGFLATELINKLISLGNYRLFTLSRNKEQLKEKYQEAGLTHFDLEDFNQNRIDFDKIDTVVHCAFARANKGGRGIADSLDFTRILFEKIRQFPIKSFINISTQEVYGKLTPPWKENMDVSPQTVYGFAKYYSELLTKNIFSNLNTSITNLRLPGLIGKDTDARMVNKFVQSAIDGNTINITGGSQQFSQLYVQDAADGIIALLNAPVQNWKTTYNLGYLKSYSIMEIANIVTTVATEYNLPEIQINLNKTDDTLYAEMDSSLFYQDTNWQPQYDMESIVREIFEHKLNQQ